MDGHMITISKCAQRTPEWFLERAGRVTGSSADTVLMGKTTAGRKKYLRTLVLERITRHVEPMGFTSGPMQHGIDTEPSALMALEDRLGILVRTTGFVYHHEKMIGSSLDGDVNDLDTIVEIKCPNRETHIGYLDEGVLPKEYTPQVMHNMLVTGARNAIFCSYDPRLPAGLDLFIKEVKRSDMALTMAEYEKSLDVFLADADALEMRLRRRLPFSEHLQIEAA